jgi:flagellar biosynthetic protein FlhB
MAGKGGGDKSRKTEPPSARRKKEARSKGEVPRSPDLAGWIMVLGMSAVLPLVLRSAATRLMDLEALSRGAMESPTPASALRLLGAGLGDFLSMFLPIAGVVVAVVLVVNVAQVGFLIAPKKLMPDPKRINPAQGLKRLVSPTNLWEMGKQAVKLAIVGTVAVRFLWSEGHLLVSSRPVSLGTLLGYTGSSLLGFLREVSMLALVIAAADYLFQRRQHRKSLMMTKEEQKEERRAETGDPHTRQAVRGRQFRMSRLRMMAAVAKADVVVTNPTHVAVALRYDRQADRAPKLVAKGADDLALRIRAEAARHGVPVVEDPPLARAVFQACQLDAEVPPELYIAVARLLAFVYTLPSVARAYQGVHRRPRSAMAG